ncbi:MAG: hypothetical protein E7354_04755 [Clostridiales bacterium]|nr:hypothetical protein [Clostridiales bacterium]
MASIRFSFSTGGSHHHRHHRHSRSSTTVHYSDSHSSPKGNIVAGVICIIVAILIIIGGIYSHISHQQKLETYQSINAIITDYHETRTWDDEDGEYEYTYYPIYTFEVDGTKYVVEDNIGSGFIPDIGSRNLILYNPENPNEITHLKDSTGTALFVIGGIFLTVGTVLIIVAVVRKKRHREYLQQEVDYDRSGSSANTRVNTPSNTSTSTQSSTCPGCGSTRVSNESNCPYCGTHY